MKVIEFHKKIKRVKRDSLRCAIAFYIFFETKKEQQQQQKKKISHSLVVEMLTFLGVPFQNLIQR